MMEKQEFSNEISSNINFIEQLKNRIKNYKLDDWAAVLGLIIFSITMGFTIVNIINYLKTPGTAYRVIFGVIDRFTYQSNWLLFIYMLFYIVKPNHQFFKGNRFLIATMVYIFFTFIGYNVVLVGISQDRGYVGNAFNVSSNVWLHILAPLYFIFYGYLKMFYSPFQGPENFLKTLLLIMIYPTIYAIYLVTIPYTFVDFRENYHEFYSDYYSYDINPGDPVAYSIYGKATNTYLYPTSWIYIGVMYFGFFPGSCALFFYSWKWMNKIKRK